jgi:hypothetical protein
MDSTFKVAFDQKSVAIEDLFNIFITATNLAQNNPGVELEFRIGIPGKYNESTNNFNFNSSVTPDMFKAFYSIAEKQEMTPIHTVSIVENYDNTDIRKITTTLPNETIETVFQQKLKKGSVDTMFLIKDIDKFNNSEQNICMTRLALSIENNVQFNDSHYKINNVRNRQRWSYDFIDYIIDLTIINDNEYSIELEFSREYLLNILKEFGPVNKGMDKKIVQKIMGQKIIPPMKNLLKMLFPDTSKIRCISDSDTAGKNIPPIKLFYNLIQGSKSQRYYKDVQPKNIKVSEVPDLLNGYSFTNKLNGLRYRLFITKFKYDNVQDYSIIFLISKNDIKIIAYDTDNLLKNISNVIVDVELFFNNNIAEIHAFDSIVFDNQFVTNADHLSRLKDINNIEFYSALNKILNDSGYNFEVKKFFYSPSPLDNLTDVIRYMYNKYGDAIEICNDGIIMTPEGSFRDGRNTISKSYYDNKFPVYKWKFPNTVSIDFFIKEIDNFNKNGQINKVFELLTASYINNKPSLTVFKQFNRNQRTYYPPSVYIVNEQDPLYNILLTGQIAELGFDKHSNSFTFMKIRTDKTIPNSTNTAELTFVDMETEFTLDQLKYYIEKAMKSSSMYQNIPERIITPFTPVTVPVYSKKNCLDEYRAYHNLVKLCIITSYAQYKNVLDLGAGRGGDLIKYFKKAKIRYLWAVEPNLDNIENPVDGFKQRIINLKLDPKKIMIINEKAENSQNITNAMIERVKTTKADIVSSFFSMTFFFQNNDILTSFIDTIDRNIAENGLFIGTMMDGERTYKELAINGGEISDSNKCYYIKRQYDLNQELGIGNKVIINLSGTPTVQGDQTEWLVPFDYLVDELKKRNIVLEESLFFDDIDNIDKKCKNNIKTKYNAMNDTQKKLNHLYRYFIFKKITVPSLPTANQLKLKETRQLNSLQVYEIDQIDTQHLIDINIYQKPITRVGVLGMGSCFYHAILFNLIPSTYTKLSIDERIELANNTRIAFSDKLTLVGYKDLAGGSIEQIVSMERLKINIKNKSEWTSHESMEYIMKLIKYNIFIIADSTRQPVNFTNVKNYNKDLPSIIIFNVEGYAQNSAAHFEPIVRLNSKNTYQTFFKWDDDLVQSLYNYLTI